MTNHSILDSVKKALGLSPEYDVFDPELIMHINTVFTTLNQLGVGPKQGFYISNSEAVWEDFTASDTALLSVQSYMYLRVRQIFDPPSSSFVLSSFDNLIKELEWRLSAQAEGAFINE